MGLWNQQIATCPTQWFFLGGKFFALFRSEKYDFNTCKGFLWEKNGTTEPDFEI
jgi:hypothetical protein